MRIIGIIGGMSWLRPDLYYKIISRKIQQTLGGVHSCECVMYSMDFAEITDIQHKGQWDLLSKKMVSVAQKLELGGADIIILCINTMHKVAVDIENSIKISFLPIVDATAEEIKQKSFKKLGLLATRFFNFCK